MPKLLSRYLTSVAEMQRTVNEKLVPGIRSETELCGLSRARRIFCPCDECTRNRTELECIVELLADVMELSDMLRRESRWANDLFVRGEI